MCINLSSPILMLRHCLGIRLLSIIEMVDILKVNCRKPIVNAKELREQQKLDTETAPIYVRS